MIKRHDVRKSDGKRAVVHVDSNRQVGGHSQGKFSYRVEDFSGGVAPPRCTVCQSRGVSVIRANKDDICSSCLLKLSHALNEAEKAMGERGKKYARKET